MERIKMDEQLEQIMEDLAQAGVCASYKEIQVDRRKSEQVNVYRDGKWAYSVGKIFSSSK